MMSFEKSREMYHIIRMRKSYLAVGKAPFSRLSKEDISKHETNKHKIFFFNYRCFHKGCLALKSSIQSLTYFSEEVPKHNIRPLTRN